MIKNKSQLLNTKKLLEDLLKSKRELEMNKSASMLYKVQHSSIVSAIENISDQIDEYEGLMRDFVKIKSKKLIQLSDILISARIAKGLTQKQLAEKLGIAEQQIQRYEITDYSGASFVKLIDVALSLELDLKFCGFDLCKKNAGEKLFNEYLNAKNVKFASNEIKENGFGLMMEKK